MRNWNNDYIIELYIRDNYLKYVMTKDTLKLIKRVFLVRYSVI